MGPTICGAIYTCVTNTHGRVVLRASHHAVPVDVHQAITADIARRPLDIQHRVLAQVASSLTGPLVTPGRVSACAVWLAAVRCVCSAFSGHCIALRLLGAVGS